MKEVVVADSSGVSRIASVSCYEDPDVVALVGGSPELPFENNVDLLTG